MPLDVGRRLGSYEVIAAIGQGGMGEVYRARDAKLGRDVALKILPDAFATDPDRLARFRREAQVLASLNHPHIAQIYGLEDAEGTTALVMELVDGPTLDGIIGSIPLADALAIARQIADALETAHERGIVHRDLKPANVKISADGKVKVLDFGLAKALDPAQGSGLAAHGDVTNSPTLTSPVLSSMGMILGTAAYMSPEQARGKPVDRRADIWAFGCVLYEMLTGRRAFEAGGTVSDAVAAILRSDPDWTALPAETPAHIRTLLRRCLHKDLDKRLPHIGIARIEIDEGPTEALAATGGRTTPAPVAARPSWWRRAMPAGVAAVVAAALTGTAVWYVRPSPPHTVTRFQHTFPQGQQLLSGGNRRVVALSPDGLEVVFVAAPGSLYRRSLSELSARPIPGIESMQQVFSPVFSPDGGSVAFWTPSDRTLKRIALSGGAPVTLCLAENPRGMSWGPDGITFGQGSDGILRVAETGGTPQVLVKVESTELAESPQLLPDGDHLLFTLATGPQSDFNRFDTAQIVVQSLRSGERKTLVKGGADARYLPTGHLVYALAGNLLAVRFDPDRLEVTGGAVPVVEGVRRAPAGTTGAAQFSVSDTGSLVFVPGPTSTVFATADLALTDRQGSVTALRIPPGPYEHPRVSPDGTRIAFGSDDGREAAVWVHELSGASAPRKLTLGGRDRNPIWSPDSKRVAFWSERQDSSGIFLQVADGSARAERLTTAEKDEVHTPESWSPAAGRLLYNVRRGSDFSLWMFSLDDRKEAPFGTIRSTAPTTAMFSPDGRWVAYSVRPAGRTSVIYVEPFPPTGAPYQLPETGMAVNAHHPLWSADGSELLFVGPVGTLSAVRVTTSPAFAFGSPVAVPRTFPVANPTTPRTFDITKDGKTLGIITAGQSSSAPAETIQVVLNWAEELKRRVPAN